ncbi:MAG: glycoside hydrolase family 32 protein [Bacilli bacterium]|nr:glycoside hydrolase family 32 protein [Bacilli bacterium]
MKKIINIFVPALVIAAAFAARPNHNIEAAKAVDGPSLISEGDSFALLDKQYAADESFVFTADLHFNDGNAGGLCFGSQENDHYFVINMDRNENHVKLLHFAANGIGGYNVDELYVADFIGNNKMTSEERSMVEPKVREIENVNLKVILTVEDEHAYAEFFVEGIKRFGIDTKIDLNNLGKSYSYEGGYLGMNCFHGDIYFKNVEIGRSDYSYFSEQYRNQYHLQPFAKWTNDPNALCYYNGYYHVFYQTNPFGLYWGDMYWGHARSKDLIHFEFLPICLFPDTRIDILGPGEEAVNNGYMWSGCAISYYKGMSDDIDALSWFPNGNGNGLLAIYTREGRYQDQCIIYSDDEGLTWTKSNYTIWHNTYYTVQEFENQRIDWRDPKVVPLEKDGTGKVTRWVMTLSSMDKSMGWFLTSSNLLNWTYSGNFEFPRPECIGIGYLTDEDDNIHAYLTNKSRTYILGTLSYDSVKNRVNFVDEEGYNLYDYTADTVPLKPLDFGPDTYASQSFYINDPASEFNGKDIVLNWFSGDLNASYCTGPGEYANLRGRWNGGFTIPVEYGLKTTTEGLRLTQKPITVDNTNLDKVNIIDIAGEDFTSESDNPLSGVHTHVFELEASIETHNDSSILFRVDVGNDEYMQFGWNKTDGYYVDRTYLNDKGINTNVDWHARYSSHILGDSDVKTFYVLSDNGGLEVFCEDYSISFYFVITASIYSTGAYFKAEDAYVDYLTINQVESVYRKNTAPEEGVLYVSSSNVELGTTFSQSKFVTCWFSGNLPLNWEVLDNDDVVSYVTSDEGINLTALKEGNASFRVSVGDQIRTINVTVYDSHFDSEFTFDEENIISGSWLMASDTMIGEISSGNAFILSEEVGTDFTFTGQFDILSGVAASLVFRAASDMSSYLVANYDTNEHVVKLWSRNGELARSSTIEVSPTNITLSVKAIDRNVIVMINGTNAINTLLPNTEPLSGHFGLNVFSARAQFRSLSIVKENYDYEEGDLAIIINHSSYVSSVTNITIGNVLLSPDFYYQDEDNLYIDEEYFKLLENGTYRFRVVTSSYTFEISVVVDMNVTQTIEDVVAESEFDVVVYVGSIVIGTVEVNGEVLDPSEYSLKDYTLTIDRDCFLVGDNEVRVNGTITFKVTVLSKIDGSEETSEELSESSEESVSASEEESIIASEEESVIPSEEESLEPVSEEESVLPSEEESIPVEESSEEETTPIEESSIEESIPEEESSEETTSSEEVQPGKAGLSPLTIVLIVAGSVVVTACLAAIVIILVKKKKVK